MKTNAFLFVRPIDSKKILAGQFRLNNERVLFKVEKKLMTNPIWIDIYNTKDPVDLFVGILAPLVSGDRILTHRCANTDLSEKIFTYMGLKPNYDNVITIKSADGKEYDTSKTLLNGALKIVASNEQIPFTNNNTKSVLVQDIYYEDAGQCIIEINEKNYEAKLKNNKITIFQSEQMIPQNNEIKSFNREALLLMKDEIFRVKSEEITIDKCIVYNIQEIKVRGEIGLSIFIDFFDQNNKNILTLPVHNKSEYLLVSNYNNNPCFNVIKKN